MKEETLWRVATYGHARFPPGKPYWYDNRRRRPAGMVIFQMSIAGTIVYRRAGEEQLVAPGHGVVFAHGEDSSYGLPADARGAYENRWVGFFGAGLAEHIGALRDRFGSVIDLRDDRSIEAEMMDLGALLDRTTPADATRVAGAVHTFVMRLFSRAERLHAAHQSPAERAVEHLLSQPTLAWSLKEVASRFGCSREHLSRLFHERVGQTPRKYLAAARVDHALRLLRHTDLPVGAVAEQSGYLSVHTLRRQVIGATGMTPTEVRECA